MTTRYVGIGGNDANSGLTWALRKLTLNGAEDTPVVAGDTVYVGPGTYRELLTIDVSGSAGNPITYIGDYLGTNTDGVGGVVRLTGSADDIALTRANCITATSRNYRTFQGILIDGSSSTAIALITACSNWLIDKCAFCQSAWANIAINLGGTGTNNTIQNCFFLCSGGNVCIQFTHTSTVDNTANLVQNCVIIGSTGAIQVVRIGGVTVRNNTLMRGSNGVVVATSPAVGQTVTVNNNIIAYEGTGLNGTATTDITENYNNVFACSTARTNTTAGANSLASIPIFDTRWFFQMALAGAGPNSPLQMLSPFDLAGSSPLANVAGTSPTTTDMRGTAVQGAQREWGALEIDSTLKIKGDRPRPRYLIGV